MSPKPCKCDDFYAPSETPCRFAKHPEPALCGKEQRKPQAPDFGSWLQILADDDRDTADLIDTTDVADMKEVNV